MVDEEGWINCALPFCEMVSTFRVVYSGLLCLMGFSFAVAYPGHGDTSPASSSEEKELFIFLLINLVLEMVWVTFVYTQQNA